MNENAAPTTRRTSSLRVKLTVGLLLIIGALFAGQNAFNLMTQQKRQRDEALIANETVARLVLGALTQELGSSDIRSESMRAFINNFLNAALTLNQKNRDLAYVVVVDKDKQVVGGRVKTDIAVFPGNRRITDQTEAMAEIAKLEGRLGGSMSLVPASLVVNGNAVGRIFVGTSLARINKQARYDLIVNVVVFLGAIIIMLLYSTLALSKMVVTPLKLIVSSMRAVHQGKLDSEVQLNRGDEIGVLANTYNFMLQGLREREHLKDAFSRYVSKQVYEKFRSGDIKLEGEMRNATVLFSDIRSFTSLSEQLTPTEVVAMLNEYFTEMVEIVFKYDGFLNKFIGDAIMAIYNVPLDQQKPELAAVKTALEMVISLEKLNAKRQARGQFPIKIGIGINTGPVVAGNLGHEQRLEYTVIGDAVNLAQRLESQTKIAGCAVLVSEATYKGCGDVLVGQALPPIKVKGKQEPVITYAVYGLKDGSISIGVPQQGLPPPPANH